jgi:hypothetical protein
MYQNNPLDPQGLIVPLIRSTDSQLGYGKGFFRDASRAYQNKPADLVAANYYPDAPQLKFDTNATGIGTGIMQGLGNAVNNYQTIKNYRTRTEMLNNAVLEQRQREQQQQDMLRATEEYNAERRKTGRGLLKPEEQSFYDVLSPEEQDKILIKRATGKADAAMAPDVGAADGAKKIAEHDALVEAYKQYGPLEVKDPKTGEMIPNPVAVRGYAELMGKSPYLTLDANKDVIQTRQANVNLKSSENELQAQPGKLKREAAQDELSISKSKVELKYADALKMIDKLTGENKLEEANDLKGRLAEGRQRYDQLVGLYDSLTPGQIKLYNSQFKSMNLPYELPDKKMTPTTYMGKVTGFTDSSGHVYDANGNPKG